MYGCHSRLIYLYKDFMRHFVSQSLTRFINSNLALRMHRSVLSNSFSFCMCVCLNYICIKALDTQCCLIYLEKLFSDFILLWCSRYIFVLPWQCKWKCKILNPTPYCLTLHQGLVLCSSFLPEKVDVNQKNINKKYISIKKMSENKW